MACGVSEVIDDMFLQATAGEFSGIKQLPR